MTHLVSVITPVHPPSIPYLAEAYASLVAQELPDGWQWEWIVQEDGETGQVAAHLPNDERISADTGRRGGPGVARTLALARARGELVKVLDADDILTPGAIARDIAAFAANPSICWTTSRVLDLLPDGTTAGFAGDPAHGPLARTAVFDYWLANDYRASVHPATLCIRRDLLLALGGWMALPASEDTGLLLAASVTSDGYFNAEPGLLYRKWAGQATQHTSHNDVTERTARMCVIQARVTALLRLLPGPVVGSRIQS